MNSRLSVDAEEFACHPAKVPCLQLEHILTMQSTLSQTFKMQSSKQATKICVQAPFMS